MGRDGYIKLYRKVLDNPVVMRDADHLAIWVYLLLEARKFEKEAYLGGKKITLKPGQLTTGRKQISGKLRVTESKIQRVLTLYENEHLIEQRTTNRNRLISIVGWDKYQDNEQLSEQPTDNQRTTNEQPVNTPKESKKERKKECINNNTYSRVVEHLNARCGTNYKPETKKTRELIQARLNEGFALEDFKTVIDKKADEWTGTEFEKFLKPDTLFTNKFEGYLNQKIRKEEKHAKGETNGGVESRTEDADRNSDAYEKFFE